MAKKFIGAICCLFILLMSTLALSDSRISQFDDFADGSQVIVNANPYYTEERVMDEISQDDLSHLAVKAWYNLLEQEIRDGTSITDAMATAIFRNWMNGYAVCGVYSEDPDSILINILYGETINKKKDSPVNIYWIEWNVDDQTIRAAKLLTEDSGITSCNDIVQSDEYWYWLSLIKWNPQKHMTRNANGIGVIFDQRSNLEGGMNQYYKQATGKDFSYR